MHVGGPVWSGSGLVGEGWRVARANRVSEAFMHGLVFARQALKACGSGPCLKGDAVNSEWNAGVSACMNLCHGRW
eukprot:7445694-Alexandrium_andersonii.AAC.2